MKVTLCFLLSFTLNPPVDYDSKVKIVLISAGQNTLYVPGAPVVIPAIKDVPIDCKSPGAPTSVSSVISYLLLCGHVANVSRVSSLKCDAKQTMDARARFTEVFTHAERKEEALKRREGEARSRARRAKRKEDERLAAGLSRSPDDKTEAVPKSVDKTKLGISAAGGGGPGGGTNGNGGGGNRRRRGGALSAHRRRGGRGGPRSEEGVEGNRRPARPILVKVGGGGAGQGSMMEEPSPVLEAVVAGLRRKGSHMKSRSRPGSGMSIVSSRSSPRKRREGTEDGGPGRGKRGQDRGEDKGAAAKE